MKIGQRPPLKPNPKSFKPDYAARKGRATVGDLKALIMPLDDDLELRDFDNAMIELLEEEPIIDSTRNRVLLPLA